MCELDEKAVVTIDLGSCAEDVTKPGPLLSPKNWLALGGPVSLASSL